MVALGDLIAPVDSFVVVISVNGVAPSLLALLDTLHETVKNMLIGVSRCGNKESMSAIETVKQSLG